MSYITLADDGGIITAYEMKTKSVTPADIDIARQKISLHALTIQNYIFMTTGPVTQEARQHAAEQYEDSGGVEFAILDCLGFLRHFLHLFHRLRGDFLNAYQRLLLDEPPSAVSQALKEAFLTLRKVAGGHNKWGRALRRPPYTSGG